MVGATSARSMGTANRPTFRKNARERQDHRDPEQLFVHRVPVTDRLMLPELLPVVGHEEDQRVAVEARLLLAFSQVR
jgi:hypothetical protein